LLVALGNVALRVVFAAARLAQSSRLPSQKQLESIGFARGLWTRWPTQWPTDSQFLEAWQAAWNVAEFPTVVWLTHPSAQNMSPYAGRDTVFHSRMRDARTALRKAAREVLGWTLPARRPDPPADGIYALPEWKELIAPRNAMLDRLWRVKGI
jgi:hypothetical protein